jgi:hypothetical protein
MKNFEVERAKLGEILKVVGDFRGGLGVMSKIVGDGNRLGFQAPMNSAAPINAAFAEMGAACLGLELAFATADLKLADIENCLRRLQSMPLALWVADPKV